MESRIAELRDKEIINISDGCRFGYVGDVEVDLETGRVKALIVPGRLRFRAGGGSGLPLGVRPAFWRGYHSGGGGGGSPQPEGMKRVWQGP